MLPSFKNTALIFPEILFIQFLQLFSCRNYFLCRGKENGSISV